jgi:hypothetical protein
MVFLSTKVFKIIKKDYNNTEIKHNWSNFHLILSLTVHFFRTLRLLQTTAATTWPAKAASTGTSAFLVEL